MSLVLAAVITIVFVVQMRRLWARAPEGGSPLSWIAAFAIVAGLVALGAMIIRAASGRCFTMTGLRAIALAALVAAACFVLLRLALAPAAGGAVPLGWFAAVAIFIGLVVLLKMIILAVTRRVRASR